MFTIHQTSTVDLSQCFKMDGLIHVLIPPVGYRISLLHPCTNTMTHIHKTCTDIFKYNVLKVCSRGALKKK